MSSFPRLLAAGAGAHFGDQLAAAALPLTAVLALGAGPGAVGFLVGLQGLAWLLFSLPAGVFVDRVPKGRLIALSQAGAAAAFLIAALAAATGSSATLAIACFIGGSGAVVLSLCALALVPELVGAAALPAANARLELARAAATLVAPVAAGVLAERLAPALGFSAAALACAAAASVAKGLNGPASRGSASKPPLLAAISEGARFAARHELLRGIALCAVFWNFAFFGLMAVAVPFALQRIGLDASQTGLAQGGYGFGLLLGAALAGRILGRFEPRVILVAGPALSTLSPVLLLFAANGGGLAAAFAAFFLVGFGPMLWLICQTSICQLVTPPDLIGRVAATIQVAIYGVRPLGAFAAGAVAWLFGLDAAILLVLAAFGLSLAVPVTSALGRLKAMPGNVAAMPAAA